MGQDVERRAASGNIGGEGGGRFDTFAPASRPLQPGSEMAGDSDGRAHGGLRLRQSRRQLLDPLRRCGERPVFIEPWAQPFARLRQRFRLRRRRPGDGRRRLAATIEKYLDPRPALRRRRAKNPRPSTPERRQRAFYVLAGTERVDPVVDATAGIREAVEASYLHLVIGATRRADPEITEKFLARIVRDDIEDFGAAPPAPQIDLVLVARAPTESGFAFEHGGGFPLSGGLARLLAR
ncbi:MULTISPECIES: hypothetical protein [Methylosinus]|uniref:hypothetical protein n=1 Tax=Methylosinus TaxID=425 RepID=UPI00138B1700|nr:MULTISPECIES: hypothetical protein [Methylosinus]